jgi:hypothetical protein
VGAKQQSYNRRINPPELRIGIPSVQRDGTSSLKSTLGSLKHGLNAEERRGLYFVVLLAHTNQQKHPDCGQLWLSSMVDKFASYDEDSERQALAKAMEFNQTHRPKSKFDYSIVMQECEKLVHHIFRWLRMMSFFLERLAAQNCESTKCGQRQILERSQTDCKPFLFTLPDKTCGSIFTI